MAGLLPHKQPLPLQRLIRPLEPPATLPLPKHQLRLQYPILSRSKRLTHALIEHWIIVL